MRTRGRASATRCCAIFRCVVTSCSYLQCSFVALIGFTARVTAKSSDCSSTRQQLWRAARLRHLTLWFANGSDPSTRILDGKVVVRSTGFLATSWALLICCEYELSFLYTNSIFSVRSEDSILEFIQITT